MRLLFKAILAIFCEISSILLCTYSVLQVMNIRYGPIPHFNVLTIQRLLNFCSKLLSNKSCCRYHKSTDLLQIYCLTVSEDTSI